MSPVSSQFAPNRGSVLAFFLSLGINASALAQSTQWVGVASSDWWTVTNWSAGIPTLDAKTIISNGEPSHRDLIVPPPSIVDTARTGELTISNNGRLTFAPAPHRGLLIVHGAVLSLNGGELLLGDGMIVFRNRVVLNNGGSFDGGTGTMEFQGDVTASSGSLFDPGTGTVVLSGSGNQTISGDLQFHDLLIKTDGLVSLTGSINVSGTVTVESGSTLVVEEGATFTHDGDVQGGGSIINENELPVQMTSFSAVSSGSEVVLRWSTSTETDNAGFDVERRTIGPRPSSIAEYQKVGFVSGAGTSTSTREYRYTDAPGPGRHAYRLRQMDRDGTVHNGFETEVFVAAPMTAEIFHNYPNPFNPSTSIRYDLPSSADVRIAVLDVLGRPVAVLVDEAKAEGIHTVTWNGALMPSGVYFCRMEATGSDGNVVVDMKKLILMK